RDSLRLAVRARTLRVLRLRKPLLAVDDVALPALCRRWHAADVLDVDASDPEHIRLGMLDLERSLDAAGFDGMDLRQDLLPDRPIILTQQHNLNRDFCTRRAVILQREAVLALRLLLVDVAPDSVDTHRADPGQPCVAQDAGVPRRRLVTAGLCPVGRGHPVDASARPSKADPSLRSSIASSRPTRSSELS